MVLVTTANHRKETEKRRLKAYFKQKTHESDCAQKNAENRKKLKTKKTLGTVKWF